MEFDWLRGYTRTLVFGQIFERRRLFRAEYSPMRRLERLFPGGYVYLAALCEAAGVAIDPEDNGSWIVRGLPDAEAFFWAASGCKGNGGLEEWTTGSQVPIPDYVLVAAAALLRGRV
jgi:hypothetical protein